MQTTEFLRLVLPDTPVLYAVKKHKTWMQHIECQSIEQLANVIRSEAAASDVYFALAAYHEKRIKTDRNGNVITNSKGNPKYEYRTKQQVRLLKALWLDIDISPDGDKCYRDMREAFRALADFVKNTGLPAPMLVSSGGGLHVYWPFAEAVTREQWLNAAARLHELTKREGLHVDPTRTKDEASILRPAGALNHKYETPQPVRVLNKGPVVSTPFDELLTILTVNVPHVDVQVYTQEDTLDELESTSPPANADMVAEACAVMAECKRTRGNVDEPTWRGMLGVLKFCADGEKLAHEWSSGHPAYDYSETQDKLDRYKGGPTTCEYFESHNPDTCANCPHNGAIKSPIVLGRPAVAPLQEQANPQTVTITEVSLPDGTVLDVEEQVVEIPPLPQGFNRNADGSMYALEDDGEGGTQRVTFSTLTWYPFARIRREDGTYAYRCKVHKQHGVHEFELEAGALASPATLIEALSQREVFIMNQKARSVMHRYAVTYCANMVNSVKPVHTYDQFGWDEHMDGFVLGRNRITAEDIEPVVLDGNAEVKAKAFTKLSGDPQPWIEAANWLYARDSMEPMQYALLSGFGSLLGKFIEGEAYAGIPCAITSTASGLGKTTVAKIALSAFGDWREMFLSSTGGATRMARISTISAMNNLPVLLDELTDIDASDLTELLYSVSNGRERQRLDQSGALRKTASWNSSVYITANENFINKLAAMKMDTEANQVRIFEIDPSLYGVPHLDPVEVDKHVEAALRARGAVGLKFIQFIVKHKEVVRRTMQKVEQALVDKSKALRNAPLRFYRYHAICTLSAGLILQQLGIIRFDMRRLSDWTVRHIAHLHQMVSENKAEFDSPMSLLDELVRWMAGNGHLLYTSEYGSKGNRPVVLSAPQRELKARLCGGDRTVHPRNSTLIVPIKDLKAWCTSKRMSVDEFLSRLPNGTELDRTNIKLGANTDVPSGVSRCIVLDAADLTENCIELAETSEQ